MSQSNDIVCRFRPFVCFTCPYRECRNGASPSRAESEFLKCGIDDEATKKARLRWQKREWARKNYRRLKNGKAVH